MKVSYFINFPTSLEKTKAFALFKRAISGHEDILASTEILDETIKIANEFLEARLWRAYRFFGCQNK